MWDNRSNISEPDQRVKGSCVGSLVVKLIMGPPTSASKVATVSLVAAAASVGIALYVCQQRKGWTLGCPAILSRHVKPRQDETSGGQDDSQAFADIATVDFDVYAHGTAEERQRECDKTADSMHRTGCLLVRDSRVREADNTAFLDLLERYYASSDGTSDARPQYHFQVGVTPEYTELPRNHCPRIESYPEEDRPLTICPPEADPKWRFFWRIGPSPASSQFPQLNMEPVVPLNFPEWSVTMDSWGHKMLDAVTGVAMMVAQGFNLPPNTFTDMMQMGPHLLAPTGSDFNRFGKLGTVLAGYHYDLNFLTIHGKSRFPGLYIWLRDGRKAAVRVPEGCLLVQAGKQMEHVTGGRILAGFHEVVVSPSTVKVIEARRSQGQSLWRVSSTLFSHIASDQVLRPLPAFATPESLSRFPPILAGQQVLDELAAIKLGKAQDAQAQAQEA